MNPPIQILQSGFPTRKTFTDKYFLAGCQFVEGVLCTYVITAKKTRRLGPTRATLTHRGLFRFGGFPTVCGDPSSAALWTTHVVVLRSDPGTDGYHGQGGALRPRTTKTPQPEHQIDLFALPEKSISFRSRRLMCIRAAALLSNLSRNWLLYIGQLNLRRPSPPRALCFSPCQEQRDPLLPLDSGTTVSA